MKIVFLGPPGAGKGTIATKISRKMNIPSISTGDLFREAVKKKSELGIKVKGIMERGELVPDDLTVSLISRRLSQKDAQSGFILDGFPRTIHQAESLDKIKTIDAAFSFDISDEQVINRLSGRRICRSCGAIYHIENMPPKKENQCNLCGGDLFVRDDDKVDAIKNRLKVYYRQTAPLILHYQQKDTLKRIDASKSPDSVCGQIDEILNHYALGMEG